MFKTTQELQDFILWAKGAKVKAFKIGDTEVEFTELAFIDAISEIEPEAVLKTEEKNTSKTLVDTLTEEDLNDDELLDWSSRP